MCALLSYLYNEPLKKYSTIKIGGSARQLAVITDEKQLLSIDRNIPLEIIGKGSNVLFSDNGFDGLVLVLKNSHIRINGRILTVGAGTSLPEISKACEAADLSGAEWACGIPSSLGGAILMNAGACGSSMSDILISCRVLRENKIVEIPKKNCGFGYRDSIFKGGKDVILSAKLRLAKSKSHIIREKMQENIALRKSKQPSGFSLGSVFKNADKPAGYYIDQAGLKGRSVGDLYVSQKHANFIINRGSGTAKDFLALVGIVKAGVFDRFGVILKEEFIKIGDF